MALASDSRGAGFPETLNSSEVDTNTLERSTDQGLIEINFEGIYNTKIHVCENMTAVFFKTHVLYSVAFPFFRLKWYRGI